MATETLAQVLARNTKEGELYERLPDGKVRCFACGHRCPIPEGKAGVCRVRFNEGGKLYVPFGYVGALQDDPIEKKPFFHAMPGVRALSFGMLGCDFHCGYCFTGSTRIATTKGMLAIGDMVSRKNDAEVYTHTGSHRAVKFFFQRTYHGTILRLKPAFLPKLECTPEHPLLTRLRPDRFPDSKLEYLEAGRLTQDHCLVLPKNYRFSESVVLDLREYLEPLLGDFRIKRTIPAELLERIVKLSEQGETSRRIASQVGKSGSHVRHLRSHIRRGDWSLERLNFKKAVLVEKEGWIRISKEHAPGIPSKIRLGPDFAKLLGFYCAEGSVTRSKNRVHAATLNFSFSKKEKALVEEVRVLLQKIFKAHVSLVHRETTLAVATSKTSLALLFKALCGERGIRKKVPEPIFRTKREVAQSFLDGYVAGDGYRAPDGQIRISTISEELAWGVAWLVQKLGYLPQVHRYPVKEKRQLLGRTVRQSPWVYLVRWYEMPKSQRHCWEDNAYRYVLLEKIENFEYDGLVYNLETEKDHSYLANFVAAHNCQNWVTSQALRDPEAVAPAIKMNPTEIVNLARERKCEVVASTYNEPLITSEWAVQIFKEARKAGLVTAYISNGNGTPEVLDYIRPWVDLYKVDLKSFDDRHYRELGGTLGNVLATIRGLYERKFWLEVLTLLIPGFNDSDDELKRLTAFVVSVSPDIPWHVTAFHQDYKMTDHENTTARHLLRACEIGKSAGLKYIYAGNLPGMTGDWENTYCPGCHELLIKRIGFKILEDKIGARGGRCPQCQTQIPGFWKKQHTHRPSENRVQPLL